MVLTMGTRGAFFNTNAGYRYATPNGVRDLCFMIFYHMSSLRDWILNIRFNKIIREFVATFGMKVSHECTNGILKATNVL